MTICSHIRRPDPSPVRGEWLIGCDCGWSGRTPGSGRTAEQIRESLERLFIAHVPEGERRTHLLVDTRRPQTSLTLEQIRVVMAEAGEKPDDIEAHRRFVTQPAIIGTFVMPLGQAVQLLGAREDAGTHYGRYRLDGGPEAELPIGEVRTADARVFRLDE